MTKRNDEGTGRYSGSTVSSELFKSNIEKFHEFQSAGTLGNNGPSVPGGGTSFATDRWKSYAQWLFDNNRAEYDKFKNATGMSKDDTTKAMQDDDSAKEFIVDKNEMIITDTVDLTDGKFGVDSLKGDKTGGMLTEEIDDGTEMPADGSYLSIDSARNTMESNKAAINDKYKKINEDLINEKIAVKNAREEAKRRESAQDKISGVKEKLSDILTKYDAVAELDKQQAAAAEKKAEEENQINEMMGSAEMDQSFMEADADANMLDEAFSDADLESRLSGASQSQDAMEADADIRDNPMLSLTDKEKGDFEFKALEPKDESGQEGISMIMQEAGLDANQAKALYGKLKGMCK